MKISNAKFKEYRLEFNIDVLKTTPYIQNNTETVLQLYNPTDGIKDSCTFGLRFASHCIEISSKKEVVGYLSEYSSHFIIENKTKDLIDVKRFVENALLNHETYFIENKPQEVLIDNLILNPNIDGLTKEIIDLLMKRGYYDIE